VASCTLGGAVLRRLVGPPALQVVLAGGQDAVSAGANRRASAFSSSNGPLRCNQCSAAARRQPQCGPAERWRLASCPISGLAGLSMIPPLCTGHVWRVTRGAR
jgi:hypothetical protein